MVALPCMFMTEIYYNFTKYIKFTSFTRMKPSNLSDTILLYLIELMFIWQHTINSNGLKYLQTESISTGLFTYNVINSLFYLIYTF